MPSGILCSLSHFLPFYCSVIGELPRLLGASQYLLPYLKNEKKHSFLLPDVHQLKNIIQYFTFFNVELAWNQNSNWR